METELHVDLLLKSRVQIHVVYRCMFLLTMKKEFDFFIKSVNASLPGGLSQLLLELTGCFVQEESH